MSVPEVGHRALRAVQARLELAGVLGRADPPAPDLSLQSRAWLHANPRVSAPRYLAAADAIVDGFFGVFALNLRLGAPPSWNRDPKTGIEAPLSFGKLLDYRDPDVVGDIKYLWEVNRHAHLVKLAQAFALTGRRVYFETIAEHLESWFIACPCPYGANWASALEAGLRLISWSAAWQLLGGAKSPLFQGEDGAVLRRRWLESVYAHARFIRGWFSAYSSANNHLMGEAAGLYIAALTWPHWPAMRAWGRTAKAILEREALAQTSSDGVNREQAVAYHHFVLDLLVLCLLAGKANGEGFSPPFEACVEAMLDHLASIMDAGGNVPMFGDSDDARALFLDQDTAQSPYRALLALGAVLFDRGDFKLKAAALDDKTRWLLGPGADDKFEALDCERTRMPPRQTFADAGYYVLGCDFDKRTEVRIVADAGPLGYRSIAAHGHADALSFTLSARGKEFLLDPGTYSYHTHGAWRRYFRGTSAHNTIRVDGLDQSVQGGNFLWLKRANAGCSLWLPSAEKDCFEGWHDGYMRLDDPVKHRRAIVLDKLARRAVVEDVLEMEADHDIELFFHCHEDCRVEAADGGFLLTREETTLHIVLPQAERSSIQVYRGSLAPICGWVSRRFDQRTPAPTIAWQARLAGCVALRTEIRIA